MNFNNQQIKKNKGGFYFKCNWFNVKNKRNVNLIGNFLKEMGKVKKLK